MGDAAVLIDGDYSDRNGIENAVKKLGSDQIALGKPDQLLVGLHQLVIVGCELILELYVFPLQGIDNAIKRLV